MIIKDIYCRYCNKIVGMDENIIETKLVSSYELFDMICEIEETLDVTFEKDDLTSIENFACVNYVIALLNDKYMR